MSGKCIVGDRGKREVVALLVKFLCVTVLCDV